MTFSREPDELTDDALTDRVRIFQRKNGHRYSVDDVATAWLALRAADPQALSCLDLGCGIGSVLLMLADRLNAARVVGIEAQAVSYALAERNIERNRLGRRVSVQFGDLRDPALLDRILQAEVAFGRDAGFDLVTGTPPYKPPGTASLSPDPQRAHARVELRGGVEAYLSAAARVLAPNGVFVMCAQSEQASRVSQAAQRVRFASLYRVDVIPRLSHKARLFSVHVFVRDTAADGGQAVLERLQANVAGLDPLETDDEDGECLILRDEAGERTPSSRALRAFFGLVDAEHETEQDSAAPARREEMSLVAAVEQRDSVS
jgi:tRNA1(Val) A37 N6-methylase TrmN6